MKEHLVALPTCPPDQELNQLLWGELNALQESKIDAHISQCEVCQSRLETLTDSEQLQQWKLLLEEGETDSLGVRSWHQLHLEKPDSQLVESMKDQGFILLESLGRGGMGQVYRARQESPQRMVAIKMLRKDNADSAGVERMLREADAIANINHPNVLRIFQVGQCQGRPFLVLEYVSGPSLAQYSRLRPLAPHAIANWMVQIASGIGDAHRIGILHRDLKPANLLLAPKVQESDTTGSSIELPALENKTDLEHYAVWSHFVPKVADFGLARSIRLDDSRGGPTHTRQLLGTPAYMSPEQIAGQNDKLDQRIDIYALGVILYELLTGTVPFRGSSQYQLLKKIETQEPRRPRSINQRVPVDLEAICLKCLEKQPQHRYESAEALADDLNRFLQKQPVLAQGPSVYRRLLKQVTRHPRVATLSLALLLTLGFSIMLGKAWLEQRNETASQYEYSLQRAQKMIDQAALSPLIEVNAWEAALSVAEQAMDLERSAASRSEQPARRLFVMSRERLKDHRFARNLDDLWIQAIVARALPPSQTLTEQYRTCFAEYGLEVAGPLEDTFRTLEDKPASFRARILTAIHHFHVPLPDGPEKLWCKRLLNGLEDNPWRQRLFETVDNANLNQSQLEALTQLLENPDLSVDPETLALAAGYLFATQNSPQQTVNYLKKSQQVYSDSFWLNYFLAKYIRLIDHPRVAIPFARAALAKRNRPAMRTFLSEIYHDSGQFEEEEKELLEALGQDPNFEPAQYALAECYHRQGKFDKAIEAYRESLRRTPWRDQLRGKLLECYVQAGKHESAEKFANELIEASGDDHSTCHARAQAFQYLQKAALATEEYERAIRQDPSCLHCYLEVARIYEKEENLAKAEQHLQTFLAHMPTGIEAGRMLIDVLLRQQKNEPALALAQRRTEQLASIPSVWRDFGRLQASLGRDKLAEESYQQILSLQANDVEALVELGKIHHRQKQYAVAESEFRAAIRHRPESELANGALIDFLFKLRRNKEAVEVARRLAEHRPESIYARWKFMEALRTAGNYQQALEVFHASQQLDRNPPRYFTSAKSDQLEYCLEVESEYNQLGDFEIESLTAEQASSFAYVVLTPREQYVESANMIMHAIQDRATMSSDGMYFSAVFESALLSVLASQVPAVSEREQQQLRAQAIKQLEAFVDEFEIFVKQRPDFALKNQATWRLIPDNHGIAALRDERLLLNLPRSQAERCRKLWARFETLVEGNDPEEKQDASRQQR